MPYKRNFLKKSLVRLDFASPVECVGPELPREVQQVLSSRFPKSEPRELIMQALQIAPGKPPTQEESKHQQWVFHGPERDRKAVLSKTEFLVEYDAYQEYAELKLDFENILRALKSMAPDMSPRRLGIRFVNVIDLAEPDPLSWEKYIRDECLVSIRLVTPPESIARVITLLESIDGDRRVRFQFGMNNPDFPAAIHKKVFVLDIDAATENVPEDVGACIATLDVLGKVCCARFEASIKPGLRELMGGWVHK